jgi:DNA mismatch repair protein MutH
MHTMTQRRPPPATPRELEIRAEALTGHTVGEVAAALGVPLPRDPRRAKGFVGGLLERALGADPAAGEGPDFPALGIELKSIPLGARGRPAESTFVCSIRMSDADEQGRESSRLRRRLARVLFVPVDAARLAPLAARRFGAPSFWTPDAREEAALRADWEDLMGAIGAGRGGTLSAREGRVLQVRPKAASSAVRTLGPGAEQTLPLGFYLRASFTAGLLPRRS